MNKIVGVRLSKNRNLKHESQSVIDS
jgi:hypothetical protein